MNKVLILDGRNRSALAATRSLGRKGVPVVVAAEIPSTIAGRSKFCREEFIYPSPAQSPEKFMSVLQREIARRDINVLMPMTEITTSIILKERERLRGVHIPFAPFETFDLLTDKWRLVELARHLGIAVPKTYFIRNCEDLADLPERLKFPVVMKPIRSRICCEGQWLETSVKYAHSLDELHQTAAQHHCFSDHSFMVQEYIRGQGEGVFTLYNQGEPLVFFGHRRLRENPPSGGVSVLCESKLPNDQAQESARTLLDFVKWHGVAMVEFKVAGDGTPYLMEVNARFWGSLQLAIDAGVDFPWMLYQLAEGQAPGLIDSYKLGVRNRWLLGDAAHLFKLFRRGQNGNVPSHQKWMTLLNFLNFFERDTRYEVNRWDDLRPFMAELKQRFLH